MAYEVTKRISGRDYRYRVEGYRDPLNGRSRTRWQYLGRVVDGAIVTPPTRRGDRVTKDKIIAATAELLESRDASRVTIGVIANRVGISQATFYRYFRDRKSAFTAALSYLVDRTIGALPSLENPPIGTALEESRRIFCWLESMQRSVLHQRAFRLAFVHNDRSKAKAHIERSMLKVDAYAILAAYLRRLDAAGVARIDDADALVESIMGIGRALIRSRANEDEHDEFPTPQLQVVFPLIERAVFGNRLGRIKGTAAR